MKLTTTTSTTTTVKGQISEEEIVDFIRQTFSFPPGAKVELFIDGPEAMAFLGTDTPLSFIASWKQENKPLPEQDVPMRIVTTRTG